MSVFKYPLKINQGSTFDKTVTWKTGTPPVPVDLTGCTARGQIRSEISSAAVLVEMNTVNGRLILGGVDGTIRILFEDELTETFSWDSGVYDIEIVFPDGTVQRKLAGAVSVSPEVTRA
jgi:uncharacterized protein YfaP (DUF2135 family)